MSVRFIGYESYVPETPGNFSKGKTKVIRISTLPDQLEHKSQKMNKYRQQLDKQVEQVRRRKLQQKKRQQEEDKRRQKLFYQSLEVAKRHSNRNHTVNHVQNFHLMHSKNNNYKDYRNNPQVDWEYESDEYQVYDSRLQKQLGRNKIKLDVPIFQRRSDLIVDEDNYNDSTIQKRRRVFVQEMDRSLLDAHIAIERSRNSNQMDQYLQKLKRRLKTEERGREVIERERNYNDFYKLPFKSPSYNSPYKYHHRRDLSWA